MVVAKVEKSTVVERIRAILDRINEEMELAVPVSEETPLIGGESGLDSVAFLNMIGLIEEWLEEEYDLFIAVISPDEDFSPAGTFGSVGRLAEYLVGLIGRERKCVA